MNEGGKDGWTYGRTGGKVEGRRGEREREEGLASLGNFGRIDGDWDFIRLCGHRIEMYKTGDLCGRSSQLYTCGRLALQGYQVHRTDVE